jgi:hypothetical protein
MGIEMTRGVVYVAIGAGYLAEAVRSVRSLKKHNDLPATLLTDQMGGHEDFDTVIEVRDVENPHLVKVGAMLSMPYARTLFLDTDTRVLAPIDELFQVLDHFDLTAVPDNYLSKLDGVPISLPPINSGVVAFRRCDVVELLLMRWMGKVRASGRHCDQDALRAVLWDSPVRLCPLPNTYNLRSDYVTQTKAKVKIIHGRRRDLDAVAGGINADFGLRIWRPDLMEVRRA